MKSSHALIIKLVQIGFKWIKLAFSVGELFVVICGNLWLIFYYELLECFLFNLVESV